MSCEQYAKEGASKRRTLFLCKLFVFRFQSKLKAQSKYYFFASYDVDATLGSFVELTAHEVVDG